MKETNMEHYRGDIEAVRYCISLHNGEVRDCNEGSFNCLECGFQNMYKDFGCQRAIIRWLMSEYKPEPLLTEREKHFVEFAQDGWLARTEDEKLMWHQDKPCKSNIMWFCHANQFCLNGFADMFPFITWEDEEPWAVEELRKLKVEDA